MSIFCYKQLTGHFFFTLMFAFFNGGSMIERIFSANYSAVYLIADVL